MRRTSLAHTVTAALTGAALTTTGCVNNPPFGVNPEDDRAPIVHTERQAEALASSVQQAQDERYRHHDTPFAGVDVIEDERQAAEQADWLQKRVTLKTQDVADVNAAEMARMFRQKGLAITSSLPLESYSYNGYGVEDVSILTALRVLYGSMGLDYRIDLENKVVEITPMEWETWYVNLGNRVTSFASGGGMSGQNSTGSNNGTTSNSGMFGDDQGGSGNDNTNGSSTESSSNQQGSTGNTSNSGAGGGGSISVTDDFWSSLEDEMKKRLTMLMPKESQNQSDRIRRQIQAMLPRRDMEGGRMPPPEILPPPQGGQAGPQMAGAAPGNGANNGGIYQEVQLGRYALNRETGAISVQAPRWVQEGIAEYIEQIESQYDTSREFRGKLFLVSTDQRNRAGIDLSAFADFADNYGLYVQNNSLGGVTVSRSSGPGGMIQPVAGDTIGTSLIGAKSADNTLQVFNAFLEQQGEVSVIQEPSLSTTSGVPATFSKFNPLYYNTVSQNAAVSEGGGAVVGTQNNLTRVDLGTRMSINPRFDPEKRLIRAQIDLRQVVQSGTQIINQTVSDTEGSTRAVPVEIPITEELSFSGETLLHDGDLIIMGGQRTTQTELNGSGTTGLRDVPVVGSLFGTRSRNQTVDTYYFALQVEVTRK